MSSIITNLITGEAGFICSYLLESLLNNGEKIIFLDNFFLGSKKYNEKCISNSNFKGT